jgi:hypothetical protein
MNDFFKDFLPKAIHPTTGLPVHLYPYEQTALENLFTHQKNLWQWGRQTGKSSNSGLFLAFMSQQIRGDAIIGSFKYERSKEIVKWCRDWLMAYPDREYANNIALDATTHLTFKTGFRIIALPRGESSRGYASCIRIMDESQLIEDRDLAAFLPTGLATAPKDLFMGTVDGTSSWWWKFNENAEKMGYGHISITSEDATQPNGPIIKSELDALKLQLGDLQYQQECLLIPIPGLGNFYPADLIKGVPPDKKGCYGDTSEYYGNAQGDLIIGWDHAVSSGDESVAFVGELKPTGQYVEVETWVWKNTLLHEQANQMALKYPNADYIIDATSEGGKEAEGTARRESLTVLPVDFGKSKATLVITQKNAMQEGLFKFHDEGLFHQLLNYAFEETDTPGRYKYGKKEIPDDRHDAAALGNYGAWNRRGYARLELTGAPKPH